MHELLVQADPKAAEEIHENNVKRVIRALEYHEQTGGKISAHNEAQHQRDAAYRFYYFVLTDDRAKLYERIDRRVDQMLKKTDWWKKSKGCSRKAVTEGWCRCRDLVIRKSWLTWRANMTSNAQFI